MSKAYFFAIFLLAASFTGCIGDENLDELSEEESTAEEETTNVEDEEQITPVGTNTTATIGSSLINGRLTARVTSVANTDPESGRN